MWTKYEKTTGMDPIQGPSSLVEKFDVYRKPNNEMTNDEFLDVCKGFCEENDDCQSFSIRTVNKEYLGAMFFSDDTAVGGVSSKHDWNTWVKPSQEFPSQEWFRYPETMGTERIIPNPPEYSGKKSGESNGQYVRRTLKVCEGMRDCKSVSFRMRRAAWRKDWKESVSFLHAYFYSGTVNVDEGKRAWMTWVKAA